MFFKLHCKVLTLKHRKAKQNKTKQKAHQHKNNILEPAANIKLTSKLYLVVIHIFFYVFKLENHL